MPVTVIIREKKVTLVSETASILQYYEQSLKGQQLRWTSSEQGAKTSAAPDEIKDHQGFLAKYVSTTLETITKNPHGAKFLIFPCLELELEVPAEMLLRSYLKFLNELLMKQSLNSEDTEVAEITSRYILTHELLYRLVGIALSNKLDYQHDGEVLLSVLHEFIKKITESEILLENPLLGSKKASKFLSNFVNSHPQWVNTLTNG